MEGAIAAQCRLWGAMTTCFSPNSPEGHSLSCHGFCGPILGPFTVVSAKLLYYYSATATLSAARSLAELGTKGVLGVEVPACPKLHWICWSEHPVSIPQAPHTSLCLNCLPWSRGFPSLCHVLAEDTPS